MAPNTRDKILDATIELLWQHSYGTVSVEHICQAAGIQKGSFYHYFPSKVDVVIVAFEKFWQDKRPLFDGLFSASVPPLERLENYCAAAYSAQKEKTEKHGKVLGCPYMACGAELSTQDERIRLKMHEIFARSSRYFESLLRDARADGLTDADPATTAQEMLAYVSGVMYQAKLKNDVEIIRRDLRPGLMRFFDTDKAKRATLDRPVNSELVAC